MDVQTLRDLRIYGFRQKDRASGDHFADDRRWLGGMRVVGIDARYAGDDEEHDIGGTVKSRNDPSLVLLGVRTGFNQVSKHRVPQVTDVGSQRALLIQLELERDNARDLTGCVADRRG